MSQSLVKNYVHIVFSTKHWRPLIFPTIETELYSYLGGIYNNLECVPLKIGGHVDHVHILCALSKKLPLMKLLEEVKSHSSKWMKTKNEGLKNFYWQDGYGAFSVNPYEVDVVKSYVKNQYEHYKKKTFSGRIQSILRKV